MSTSTYTVTGMTCGHCVSSVTEEVSAVSGITDVAVDLDSGRLTVTGESADNVTLISGAVEEAGYALVSPASGPDQRTAAP